MSVGFWREPSVTVALGNGRIVPRAPVIADQHTPARCGGENVDSRWNQPFGAEYLQSVMARIRRHAGEGYKIALDHKTSDRPGGLVDLLLYHRTAQDTRCPCTKGWQRRIGQDVRMPSRSNT